MCISMKHATMYSHESIYPPSRSRKSQHHPNEVGIRSVGSKSMQNILFMQNNGEYITDEFQC